ncbi:bifunctional DNA-formamidopyrimidine glycosylase/DNA-(apurinic or apyrimidinic site) lyase [Sphingomicrobium sp. XHP0239]|uniref:bifunctional DNA-formamidopyrimidine glycosylase/DNA-(apurinic or apyrimidinic site) lyase n=1 Tax=Sphingomicrobium maritimum TaxID=3133972 RepID=UPI0031CCD364
MPELPEVETTVRGLRPILEGATITRVVLRRADLRRPFPEGLGQALTSARVTELARRAKYGLVRTDRGDTMIFHLGMSGRWRIDPETLETHDHLVLETGEGRRVALNDPRRFGSIDLVRSDAEASFAGFAGMGPEPLPVVDAEELRARLAGKKVAIKLALLDQRVIAGLGNIYVCEALFRAGIAPGRKAGSVSRMRLERLAQAIPAVLDEAIAAGGSTLRDYAQPDGDLGYFSKKFDVYGREGKECHRCGAAIRRRVQGGRSTFYCARCQR